MTYPCNSLCVREKEKTMRKNERKEENRVTIKGNHKPLNQWGNAASVRALHLHGIWVQMPAK